MPTKKDLKLIFDHTEGHCHFCGDRLVLKKYGWKDMDDLKGAWEADHVIQRAKGGRSNTDNFLPACTRCNRLRWHRKGTEIREVILLGLIAKEELKKKSEIGKTLIQLKKKRLLQNKKRRRGSLE